MLPAAKVQLHRRSNRKGLVFCPRGAWKAGLVFIRRIGFENGVVFLPLFWFGSLKRALFCLIGNRFGLAPLVLSGVYPGVLWSEKAALSAVRSLSLQLYFCPFARV